MKSKISIKEKVGGLLLLGIWIIYYVQAFNLFDEVKDLVTPGAAYMIRLLEFTNYRGSELSLLLIEFFVLISVNHIFCLYLYKMIAYTERKVFVSIFIVINSVLLAIACVIVNIYWVVYVLLAALSFLVVLASVNVSNVFFKKHVQYDKGDIIFNSEGFESEEKAKKEMMEQINRMDRQSMAELSGDVFAIDNQYYFEIYANETLILDTKGEIIVHE